MPVSNNYCPLGESTLVAFISDELFFLHDTLSEFIIFLTFTNANIFAVPPLAEQLVYCDVGLMPWDQPLSEDAIFCVYYKFPTTVVVWNLQ